MHHYSLTRREREIAEAYAHGATHRDIAARLFIAPATVRTHLRKIYQKLGITSKVGLLKKLEGTGMRSTFGPEGSGIPLREAGEPALGKEPRAGSSRERALRAFSGGLLSSDQIGQQWRWNEEQCRLLLEALPAVVFLKDRTLRYVFANRLFLSEWGLRPQDLIGRTQQEVFSGGLGFAWSRATDDRDGFVVETGEETGFYAVSVPTGTGFEKVLWAKKLPLQGSDRSDRLVLTIGFDLSALSRPSDGSRGRSTVPPVIAPRSSGHGGSARILIVDPASEVRRAALFALEQAGHITETAAGWREAYAILASRTFDLVVADHTVRDAEGLAFHEIVAVRQPKLLKRLILTHEPPLPADLEQLLAWTGIAVLEKPFSPAGVVECVEARLRSAGDRDV